jgi:Fe-S cluster assembly protein SufD
MSATTIQTPIAPVDLTGFTREAVLALSQSRNEPDWVREARLTAWDVYESIPMPSRSDEEWRRTDLRRLKLDRFKPFGAQAGRSATLDDLVQASSSEHALQFGAQEHRAGITVSQDSSTRYSHIGDDAAAQGVIFSDLETAINDHPDLVKQYFMTEAVPTDFGKFEALHAAFWQSGTFLYVPKGVSVELPFRSFVTADTTGEALFTHSIVVVEEQAEAFFVDSFQSETAEEASFSSAVVELILRQDAKLRYVQVQDWGRHVWNFMTERAILGRDAELKSLQVTLGSKFSKNSIGSIMQGENSLAEMLGIFFGDEDQFFDHHTWQMHESPYATSDLEFKGALKGNSRSIYSGLIKVEEGAQRTDAFQQNRNLILSRGARADSIPNLEIKANDVR